MKINDLQVLLWTTDFKNGYNLIKKQTNTSPSYFPIPPKNFPNRVTKSKTEARYTVLDSVA